MLLQMKYVSVLIIWKYSISELKMPMKLGKSIEKITESDIDGYL